MNKRSTSVLGTLALASALALPRVSSAPPAIADQSNPAKPAAVETGKVEGPWVASCKYWAAARTITPVGSEPSVDNSSKDATSDPTAIGPGNPKEEVPCPGSNNPWGIPAQLPDGKAPRIITVIATVPDPIHSHMAMEFDRTIDAYTQAAGDAHFLTSYFWLPWRLHEASSKTADEEEARTRVREQQPGLIVLKQVSPRASDSEHYDKVIYLFLVAESPALGVSGTQLDYALQYERDLSRRYKTTAKKSDTEDIRTACPSPSDAMLSTTPNLPVKAEKPDIGEERLNVIGPIYSGSAASLRVGIERSLSCRSPKNPVHYKVSITGATSTDLAKKILNEPMESSTQNSITPQYLSLGEDGSFEEDKLGDLIRTSTSSQAWASRGSGQMAIFAEEGTAYGASRSVDDAHSPEDPGTGGPSASRRRVKKRYQGPGITPLLFLFPRGISVLRNTTASDKPSAADSTATDAAFNPYLPLSLKDSSADDAVVHFGAENSAVSLESEMIAITRQLQRARVRYVEITASNMLDAMYLARFIHRACPDASLVFQGGDLLFEHGADNGPYIGSLNVSAYSLKESMSLSTALHTVPGAQEEAIYNAALLTFRRATGDPNETLLDHQNVKERLGQHHPLVWVTTVGHDGYYPLGIIQDQPATDALERERPCVDGTCDKEALRALKEYLAPGVPTSPSLLWYALCIAVIGFSVVHTATLLNNNFWSPSTGDFAISKGDQPKRRAMYLNIGSSMLWGMAFVVAFPAFAAQSIFKLPWESLAIATITLFTGIVSLIISVMKTRAYFFAGWSWTKAETHTIYTILNLIAALTCIVLPLFWFHICTENLIEGELRYVGLFFSYRCLRPESGVSPIIPVMLLLLGWVVWSVLQMMRLRFSWNVRPLLPGMVTVPVTPYPFYVPDEAVSSNKLQPSCLEVRMTCLLITRHVFGSITKHYPGRDAVLVLSYFVLFGVAVFAFGVQSLERLLLAPGWHPTHYEFLVASLFFPLIMIAITGWLRMVLVWNSLRSTLLNSLEQLPIRFAFSRLRGVDWKSMLSQSGVQERWRDMGRTTESIRQMWHNQELINAFGSDLAAKADAEDARKSLDDHIIALLELIRGDKTRASTMKLSLLGNDQPEEGLELGLVRAIELDYKKFSEALLQGVLIPYWLDHRSGFIEPGSKEDENGGLKDPLLHILLAEEFLAHRYLSLVRAVLVNLRYLMAFVSTAFVLTVIAWNIYPFQPRAGIDWIFTGLLFVLGTGIVAVFAQMHRNPILSRITNTGINELGMPFFIRLATFGAVPVLTWLAYQFPGIGSTLLKVAQPGLSALK
ncbi:MAG: hypothetical protein JWM43_1124 [Acidobacteriaceae bacterium]|nr:hypothetical protein [Acidobacteriaceae bacterium]